MTPEEYIMKQGDIGTGIYFIMQGDCTVNLTDYNGEYIIALSLLVEGDHFGEISYFYKCPVTCSIISRNYNMLANITHDKLNQIFQEYHILKNYMLTKV